MGMITTMFVLNDCWHDVANDPEFGRKAMDAMQSLHRSDGPVSVSAGCCAGAAKVIETHHNSGYVPVLVGGGNARVLTHNFMGEGVGESDLETIRNMARAMGYDLRKRPSPKNKR